MRFILACCFALYGGVSFAGGYVGNVFGAEGKYRVFEFTEAGSPVRPVSGSTFAGVAWPSAIQIGNVTHVYASVLVDGKWSQIHRWSSSNGAAYVHDGSVLIADTSEPYGVGPATVTYDGSKFRIFYAVRGSSGPGTKVDLAESTDGLAFTRKGTVYAGYTYSPGGLSVSYACTDGANHYLFLHGYTSNFATADSFVVTAATVDGTYADYGLTIENNSATGTITGAAGNSFGVVSGVFAIGQALIINGTKPETYIVTEQTGNVVYLNRPLEDSHSNTPVASFISKKADLSFVRKLPSGEWAGAVTGYGQFSGVLSEFTGHVSVSSLSGSWQVGGGYFLSPYFNSGERSTENPEPIRTNASCS